MTELPRLQTSLVKYLRGLRSGKPRILPTEKTSEWEVNAEEAYHHRRTGTVWYIGVQSYRNVEHQILIRVTDAQMILLPGIHDLRQDGRYFYLIIVGGTVSVSEMELINHGIVHLRVKKGSSEVEGLVDLGLGDNEPFAIVRQRRRFHPFQMLIPKAEWS